MSTANIVSIDATLPPSCFVSALYPILPPAIVQRSTKHILLRYVSRTHRARTKIVCDMHSGGFRVPIGTVLSVGVLCVCVRAEIRRPCLPPCGAADKDISDVC